MRAPFAHRLTLLLVALLTLGACGQRAFAHLQACGKCPCGPAEAAFAAPAGGGETVSARAATEATAPHGAGEHGGAEEAVGGHHHAEGKGCSCPCHAPTVAALHAGAPPLAARLASVARLHAGPTQGPAEGVRAGIEYPPRAA